MMYHIAVTIACFFLMVSNYGAEVSGRYTIKIRAVQYTNPTDEDYDGGCCDPGLFGCSNLNLCDLYFYFCIRNNGSSTANSNGCWNTVRSRHAITTKDYTFPATGPLYTGAQLNNPITFTRNEPWPGSVQVLITIIDSDNNEDDLVDRNAFNLDLVPKSDHWSGVLTTNGHYNNAQFKIRVQLTCQTNYYGNNCTDYCRAQDEDPIGHYTCGSNGEKVCNNGYTNPSENCLTPICETGCSTQNGYCHLPGESCLCANGWTGNNCTECIPKSGCSSSNGYCIQPDDCICQKGYEGCLCTEDHDVCGHKEPCQNGATCVNVIPDSYECTCPAGYKGINCQINNLID